MTPAKTTHQGLIPAPAKYTPHPGNADLTYDAVCKVLSDRAVDWSQFGPDEWHMFPHIAQAEGVGPLLYWHFKNQDWPPGIPKGVAAALMQQYYSTLGQNTLLFRELDRILAALAEANIPVILLKGADLAQTLYPDPALRPMGDLDLLVRREDLDQAVTCVTQMGYWENTPYLRPSINQLIGHHIQLQNEKKIIVELHWKLSGDTDWRYQNLDWIWSQTKNLSIPGPTGAKACGLNTSICLSYLSAHLALQHGIARARLLWFYDVHLILENCSNIPEWVDIVTEAQKLGWVSALFVTINDTYTRFETSCMHHYLNLLPGDVSQHYHLVDAELKKSTRLEQIFNRLGSLDFSAKVKILYAYIFPSPDYIRYRYTPEPVWIWPMYYLIRWQDISHDFLRIILRR